MCFDREQSQGLFYCEALFNYRQTDKHTEADTSKVCLNGAALTPEQCLYTGNRWYACMSQVINSTLLKAPQLTLQLNYDWPLHVRLSPATKGSLIFMAQWSNIVHSTPTQPLTVHSLTDLHPTSRVPSKFTSYQLHRQKKSWKNIFLKQILLFLKQVTVNSETMKSASL